MPSIWRETAELPRFAPLQGDLHTQVLIVGGGMTGVLCAHLLREQGVDCALTEAEHLAWGTTGDTTAKLTVQHGLHYHKLLRQTGREGALTYLRLQQAALERYRALCADIACDFVNEDNYVYTLNAPKTLRAELAALQSLDYPARLEEKPPLPIPVAGAVGVPEQARFHPLKFLAAIAPGLPIYEHTKVRELLPGKAVTNRGTITADHIILATHFPILNKHGGYFLKLYQHRSYVLALKNAPLFEGMYVDGSGNGLSFRRWGELLLLGGGGHRTGKQGGGWKELEAYAGKHWPDAQVVSRWATQDCMTLDGVPYIGPYGKNTKGLWVATGFNKWGMTSAMVAAKLLRDGVQGIENPWAQVFSPQRSVLHPKLAVNAFEAAVNVLTPVGPRCPHMGCVLKWNEQERSWDCPCHGSRFDRRGRLLDNPANGNAKI
jgi:glycine/D-amino acid oxidase-like deaminating enzyme